MCGILGIVSNEYNRINTFTLNSLAHRGPDETSCEYFIRCNRQIFLGHTRLSVLELSSAGKQPMQSKNGRWWITYNGEIYNHIKMRGQLPVSFDCSSDTKTLVELIAELGLAKALPCLNGMFAFAALDTEKNQLYLVRDPVGIKPLYYTRKKEYFSFASEICALRAMGAVSGGIDTEGLQSFLTLRYVPSPKSIWKNVHRLPPGHILCLNLNNMQIQMHPFILPTKKKFGGTLRDAAECYQAHLQRAVRRQLLSDVPVGILLSGGIDSALIAAMAKEAGCSLPCFTVGFGADHAECEIRYAEDTAQTLGLSSYSVTVTPEELRDILPDIVRSVEEPLGTTSIMPMWYLVQKSRQHVTVVLTGQGADEPWGGYRRYQVELTRKLLPYSVFWQILATAGCHSMARKYLPDVVQRGLRTLPVSRISHRTLEACSLFTAQERRQLTGSSSEGNALRAIEYWCRWLELEESKCETTEQMMRLDTRMNLADDLLLYGDKISMAFSLEARVPMLDIELLSFTESLPLSYRLSLWRSKIVHRMMAENYLPSSIIHRKKIGFQVPFAEWSHGVWREYIEEILFSTNAPHFSYINKKALSDLWNEHLAKRRDRSRQIFALLTLALCLRDRELL